MQKYYDCDYDYDGKNKVLRVENHISCSKQTVEVEVLLSSVELCFKHGKTTLQPLLLL